MRAKRRHLLCSKILIWDLQEKCDIFAQKFNAKHRNARKLDSLIRNSVLSRSNFTYLYMWLDKSFHSRYKFVANSLERIRSFAKNDFVFAKQNSNHSLEHSFVAKIQYILLSKERQVSSRFEFLFTRYDLANLLALRAYFLALLANHFVSLAEHFVLLANHFHAANLFEKFVTLRAKISHYSRKSVELFAIVATLLLSVVISFVIFSTRFAIVKIVI